MTGDNMSSETRSNQHSLEFSSSSSAVTTTATTTPTPQSMQLDRPPVIDISNNSGSASDSGGDSSSYSEDDLSIDVLKADPRFNRPVDKRKEDDALQKHKKLKRADSENVIEKVYDDDGPVVAEPARLFSGTTTPTAVTASTGAEKDKLWGDSSSSSSSSEPSPSNVSAQEKEGERRSPARVDTDPYGASVPEPPSPALPVNNRTGLKRLTPSPDALHAHALKHTEFFVSGLRAAERLCEDMVNLKPAALEEFLTDRGVKRVYLACGIDPKRHYLLTMIQRRGICRILKQKRLILSHDVGFGKTIEFIFSQVLLWNFLFDKPRGRGRASILITPCAAAPQWISEEAKWFGDPSNVMTRYHYFRRMPIIRLLKRNPKIPDQQYWSCSLGAQAGKEQHSPLYPEDLHNGRVGLVLIHINLLITMWRSHVFSSKTSIPRNSTSLAKNAAKTLDYTLYDGRVQKLFVVRTITGSLFSPTLHRIMVFRNLPLVLQNDYESLWIDEIHTGVGKTTTFEIMCSIRAKRRYGCTGTEYLNHKRDLLHGLSIIHVPEVETISDGEWKNICAEAESADNYNKRSINELRDQRESLQNLLDQYKSRSGAGGGDDDINNKNNDNALQRNGAGLLTGIVSLDADTQQRMVEKINELLAKEKEKKSFFEQHSSNLRYYAILKKYFDKRTKNESSAVEGDELAVLKRRYDAQTLDQGIFALDAVYSTFKRSREKRESRAKALAATGAGPVVKQHRASSFENAHEVSPVSTEVADDQLENLRSDDRVVRNIEFMGLPIAETDIHLIRKPVDNTAPTYAQSYFLTMPPLQQELYDTYMTQFVYPSIANADTHNRNMVITAAFMRLRTLCTSSTAFLHSKPPPGQEERWASTFAPFRTRIARNPTREVIYPKYLAVAKAMLTHVYWGTGAICFVEQVVPCEQLAQFLHDFNILRLQSEQRQERFQLRRKTNGGKPPSLQQLCQMRLRSHYFYRLVAQPAGSPRPYIIETAPQRARPLKMVVRVEAKNKKSGRSSNNNNNSSSADARASMSFHAVDLRATMRVSSARTLQIRMANGQKAPPVLTRNADARKRIRRAIDLIRAYIRPLFKCCVVTGKVKTDEAIAAFLADPYNTVFIGTSQKCYMALNGIQTRCRLAVIVNDPYNGARLEQMEGRLNRLGQVRDVIMIRMAVVFDPKLWSSLARDQLVIMGRTVDRTATVEQRNREIVKMKEGRGVPNNQRMAMLLGAAFGKGPAPSAASTSADNTGRARGSSGMSAKQQGRRRHHHQHR